MAYGQPFYTFPNGTQYGGVYNNAYVPPQMPYYGAQPQMPQNAQNQPLNGFQQPQGQIGQFQQQQPSQPVSNGSQQGFPIKDIRFVTSDEAKAFIVMPNSNALLLDTVNGMAYLKSADSVGQSVTECYRFTKINLNETAVKPAPTEQPTEKKPDIDLSQFITKSDISDLVAQYGFVTAEQYKSLQDQVESLKTQIRANNGGTNNNGRNKQQTNG